MDRKNKSVISDETKIRILELFRTQRDNSIKTISKLTGVSEWTVHKVLNNSFNKK